MAEAYIYDAVRTPRGRGKKDGSLHEVPAVRLAARTLEAVRDRNGLDTSTVDDIIFGCVDGIFVFGIDTGSVITNTGLLTYAIDGGAPATETWDEIEPFVRFEWLDPDNNDTDGLDDEAMFLTFGANYYFAKHSSKVTLDVVWALDIEDSISSNPFGNSIFSDGLGFSGDGVEEDTFIVRAQYQLLF